MIAPINVGNQNISVLVEMPTSLDYSYNIAIIFRKQTSLQGYFPHLHVTFSQE